MSLLKGILEAQGGALVGQLASQFGLDKNQATSALGQLVPALGAGLSKNVSQEGGLAALVNALGKGKHDDYVEGRRQLNDANTINDGNKILGHLFGSKDVSRQVATRAAEKSGIGSAVLKKMLPVVATMVMGNLSKQRSSPGGALTDILGGGRQAPAGKPSILTSFLDADNDGSIADDLLGMLLKR